MGLDDAERRMLIQGIGRSGGLFAVGAAESHWLAVLEQIEEVRWLRPEQFGLKGDGLLDEQMPPRAVLAVSFLRRLGGIYTRADDVDEIADQVHYIVDPMYLNVGDVANLLRPAAQQMADMRAASAMLRLGHTYRAVCDKLRVSERLVRSVQQFTGVADWHTDRQYAAAAAAAAAGLTASEFRGSWNEDNPKPAWISERTARTWLADARRQEAA